MARTPQERRTIEEERIAGAVKSGDPESPAERSPEVTGSGYAYTCMSKEWRDFGFGWNAMVHALRSRDHLSNEERDELLFVMLATPAHRAFFGGEYMALPTMLTAPLFVERHNKTIIAPSWSSYPWMGPVLLQLRDLTVFVLVSLGIVLPADKDELVSLITETARHAMHCLSGHSVAEREYMLRLRKRLAALVAACLEALQAAGDGTPQSSHLTLRKARELLTSAKHGLLTSAEHGLLTEVGTPTSPLSPTLAPAGAAARSLTLTQTLPLTRWAPSSMSPASRAHLRPAPLNGVPPPSRFPRPPRVLLARRRRRARGSAARSSDGCLA